MRIISLFDGISCGAIACKRAGLNIEKYYSSEIDKNAIKVSSNHFPNIERLGDVRGVRLDSADLLLAGSPCQGFSFSGKQLNFEDERSKLFFEFVRILNETKPRYFLLENVVMKKEFQDIITKYVGVKPIKINSNLVSAQSRNRLYWTNIPIKTIEDKEIYVKDILESYKEYKPTAAEIQDKLNGLLLTSKYEKNFKWRIDRVGRILVMRPDGLKIQRIGRVAFGENKSEIITCLTQPYVFDGCDIRRISPIEAERLQTLPDDYTYGVSKSGRYKMIGNGWTVDIIVEILRGIGE
jgi:DNA-cytosine methyltransferase